MQRNNNSIMIFEIIRGRKKLTGWRKNGPAYFFLGERMGRPILSPGKKLTGGKFRPVTPVNSEDPDEICGIRWHFIRVFTVFAKIKAIFRGRNVS